MSSHPPEYNPDNPVYRHYAMKEGARNFLRRPNDDPDWKDQTRRQWLRHGFDFLYHSAQHFVRRSLQ